MTKYDTQGAFDKLGEDPFLPPAPAPRKSRKGWVIAGLRGRPPSVIGGAVSEDSSHLSHATAPAIEAPDRRAHELRWSTRSTRWSWNHRDRPDSTTRSMARSARDQTRRRVRRRRRPSRPLELGGLRRADEPLLDPQNAEQPPGTIPGATCVRDALSASYGALRVEARGTGPARPPEPSSRGPGTAPRR